MKKVAVLILNHRQDELTRQCLVSLCKVDYDNFEIILINNESEKAFEIAWGGNNPPLRIVESKENLGCAGGRNLGIDYFFANSYADYLFFLDNDTVVDSGILKELVKVAQSDEAIGLVGMKVYYFNEPHKFWFAGGARLNVLKGEFYDSGQGELDYGQYDTGKNMDSIPGGFTFIPRKTLDTIGKLDERFFIYFEDPDWCLRLRKKGLKIAFAPNAKVWHKASSSLGRESPGFCYFRTRNRLLFMWKQCSKLVFCIFFLYFILEFSRNNVIGYLFDKKQMLARASLLGFYDFLAGNYGKSRIFAR